MKTSRYGTIFVLALFAVTLTISACSSPPEDEIAAAEKALKAAADAGAEGESPRLYTIATDYLQEAKMLMEQGHYGEARKKALNAKVRAESAQRAAEAGVHRRRR